MENENQEQDGNQESYQYNPVSPQFSPQDNELSTGSSLPEEPSVSMPSEANSFNDGIYGAERNYQEQPSPSPVEESTPEETANPIDVFGPEDTAQVETQPEEASQEYIPASATPVENLGQDFDFGLSDRSAKKKNPFEFLKNKTILYSIIGVAVAILVGVGGFFGYKAIFAKNTLVVSANQSGFNISVDGQETKGVNPPYTIKVAKGEHKITASKEGFNAISKTIIVNASKTTLALEFSPVISAEKIYGQEVFFPALNTQLKNLIFFVKTEKGYDIRELDPATKKENPIIEGLPKPEKVSWSPTFRQLALKIINSEKNNETPIKFNSDFGEGALANWIVDLDRKDLINISSTPLNPVIKNITFNPDGNLIGYFFKNDLTKKIAYANTDGKDYKNLVDIVTLKFDPDVLWSPDGNRISIFPETGSGASSKATDPDVFVYNFQTKNSANISNDKLSAGALFSTDGAYLAYQSGNKVFLTNLDKKETTNEEKSLDTGVETSISNCMWIDGKTLIAYSPASREVIKIKTNGTKEVVSFNKDSVSGEVKGLFYQSGYIYLVTKTGIYKIKTETGV